MSYLVFARKYRPQTFEDIVAQEHVTRTLQNSIKNDRTGSGYLFCGPRGTGKTTTARILAKAVNCVNGPTPVPCGECSACIEITKGSSLDVLEIDAASNTGVDDIRTLRENVRYLPTNGKKRIYIIDEVHRLSGPAFDALLKTLEEPPPHVMFIFATTEPTKVPETILSRTQRFDFKRVSVADLAGHLGNIAGKEKLSISEPALRMIARKADGSVRDSLSLMDQIAAYATGEITEKEVIEALGLVDRKFLFEFTTAIAGKQSRTSLQLIKQIFDGGIDPKDFVAELLEHLRTLLVLATDRGSGELLELGEEELKEYMSQTDYFSVGDIVRLMKMGGELNRDLKDSGLDERLLLEMTAVKMAEMESTVKFEEILSMMKQNPSAAPSSDLFG
ncbi:MAG TPA: DNA polymerase III subunit gamma/tau, partial [candidate division Zixibacteria bacterium]|nr:DNA polymerase III subunit gamma/tau [candidate division Zixibacteria bacterium]